MAMQCPPPPIGGCANSDTASYRLILLRYDPIDAFFTFQDNKKPVSEIKVRAKKYQGYYTHLIELRKLMALENACM